MPRIRKQNAPEPMAFYLPTHTPVPTRDAYIAAQYASRVPTLAAIIHKIGGAVAQIVWRAYTPTNTTPPDAARSFRLLKKSAPDTRRLITRQYPSAFTEADESAAILTLLENPCAIGKSAFYRLAAALYLTTGEVLIYKQRDDSGMVTALWIVPQSDITARPAFGQTPQYSFTLFGQSMTASPADVVHIYLPDFTAPYRKTLGLAQTLVDEIALDEAISEYTLAQIQNRARPDLLITGTFDPAAARRLEQDWAQRYGGARNTGRAAAISGKDITVTVLPNDFNITATLAARTELARYIQRIFAIPPELLGDVQNSNRATISSAEYLFIRHTVEPIIEVFRSAFQSQLAPDFGDYALDYYPLAQADADLQLRAMSAMPMAFTLDEWRAVADLPPFPNGGGQFIVSNLAQIRERIPGTRPASTDEPPADETPPDQPDQQNTATAAPAYIKKSLSETDAVRIAAQLSTDDLVQLLKPEYAKILTYIGNTAGISFGLGSINFNLASPAVLEFLNTRAATRIKGVVTESLRRRIRNTLTNAVQEGLPIAKIQDAIVDVFNDARGVRSHAIARTEVHTASSFARRESFAQAGSHALQWVIAQGPVKHRDEHSPGSRLDGQVRPISEPFVNDRNETAYHPGGFGIADQDINCLCTLVPYFGRKLAPVYYIKAWHLHLREEINLAASFRDKFNTWLEMQKTIILSALKG
jgi:HK97 family phage portal protein